MPTLAYPWILVAGAVAALAPVVLHLIDRRPPRRVGFPTAVFLRPDPRAAVRMRRRPTDLLLLCTRSCWLLLLGLALSEPSWSPRRVGTVDLVLLDRGAGMAGAWSEAIAAAREALGARAGGELVLFDTVAVRVPGGWPGDAFFDSLEAAGPGSAPVDYAAALRALPDLVRGLPAVDSFRVNLVTRPRWEGWRPGLSRVREAVWPGGIAVVAVGSVDGAADLEVDHGSDRVAEIIRPGDGEGPGYLEAALAALGWGVRGAEPASGGPDPRLIFVLANPDIGLAAGGEGAVRSDPRDGPAHSDRVDLLEILEVFDIPEPSDLLARTRNGATTIIAGGAGPPAGSGVSGAVVLESGASFDGAEYRLPIQSWPGAELLATWEDGRAAAVAVPAGAGCLVLVGTGLEAAGIPHSPHYVDLIARLVGGCGQTGGGSGEAGDHRPLDTGALAILAGPETAGTTRGGEPAGETSGRSLAERAPSIAGATVAEVLGTPTGRPLGPWLALAALCVALVETFLAYRVRAS